MKANYFKATRFIAIFLAATVLGSVSNATLAAKLGEDTIEKSVVVKYLGTINAQPIFQVDLKNEKLEQLVLVLENEAGDVLYKQKTSEKNFTQKIQLETTDTEINLNLYVYSEKNKTKQVYRINKVTRVVNDLVVNESKY